MMSPRRVIVVLTLLSLSSALRIRTRPPLNCSRQGLSCVVTTSNCMDKEWQKVHNYTPSSPEDLEVSVSTQQDVAGHLQPVLLATWKIRDDGSIGYMTATELHVLVIPTNQNLCVRYSFRDQLPMRTPEGEKWSFSADMLVLDPGQRYHVSVFNIPKPELGHSSYDISAEVIVSDCQNPKMQMTQFCVERGSLWQPNISLAQVTADGERSALTVSFRPDRLCDEYIVIVNGCNVQHVDQTYNVNQTTLNATFSLDLWPRTCCQFYVEIKPLFPPCGQDCTRRQRTLDICPANPTESPDHPQYTFVALNLVVLFLVMAVIACIHCRKPGKPGVAATPVGDEKTKPQQLIGQTPKVLVIYSQDHRLYRDVVLTLCAFLQAKCGTKVLVDLLDTTLVSMVGGIRWLEWQRQQLKNPSDKILVLCSRGVQAKWRAMCGQSPVTLKEDILSPTDDMLTPFLNLFLPDMHQAGMHGKYMVAYFNDISSEHDIPSIFDIAAKYKLMKHFEELYFRILDIEKYQPGQVNHIKGIGGDEYFNCPSGRALKNAIETFQAYQLDNPDWFEKECVNSEEQVTTEANLLIDQLQIPSVLECLPLIRDGPPASIQEVDIRENGNSVQVLTPEVNPECQTSELIPLVNNPNVLLIDQLYPHSPQSVYVVEPVLNEAARSREFFITAKHKDQQIPTEHEEECSLLPLSQIYDSQIPTEHEEECSLLPLSQIYDSQIPTEHEEEGSLLPLSQIYDSQIPTEQEEECSLLPLSQIYDSQIPTEQEEEGSLPMAQIHDQAYYSCSAQSLTTNHPQSSSISMQNEHSPLCETSYAQNVEVEEYEILEPRGKGPNSESDQGYISEMSSQYEHTENPLVALARLQEELFEESLI
ncbi:interleukin 17 receptor A1a [Aulostomus maculatus]